ncbi:UNVERIFIED_CONTAM: hypothetical protein Sradi_0198400 [Sesamum radiatum]|uniref:DUF4216 domain-containing protein n=1 Tax=Sesamum radiatum TaxID=300843 RepID=A0AAW2VZC0_SESRA
MQNKAHPEGSIAKGYILEECMTFCSRYLNNVENNATKIPRNNDGNNSIGRLIGNGKEFHLDHVTWVQVHRYVIQNSDAVKSYRDSKDKRPQTGVVQYYGVLTDIVKIHYSNDLEYILFKCEWINNEKGLKIDHFKFILVNFNHVMYTGTKYSDEPYILSTQEEQVWYVDDPLEPDWKVVVKMNRRDHFDLYSWERQTEVHAPLELDDRPIFSDNNWVREGVETVEIDDHEEEDSVQDESDI